MSSLCMYVFDTFRPNRWYVVAKKTVFLMFAVGHLGSSADFYLMRYAVACV